MRAALSTRANESTRASDDVFAVARPAVLSAVLPVALAAALTWYNNVAGQRPWHQRWYPVVNGCAAATALALARVSGLTADDLGLRRRRLRAGLRLGVALASPVLAGYCAAAVIPAGRPLLRDKRVTGLSRRQLGYQVMVRIPVGTVAWEEIAFRGVLDAALRRVLPDPVAIGCSSAVFGAWHIRPAAEALAVNGASTAVRAAGVVAGTAAAGALLSASRERSGSLAAPIALHLAANCGGPLASALAARLDRRGGE
jgi:membrane protease YdiL (CAAX protease family)